MTIAAAIGDTLPLALGMAFFPIPIIAVVLLLSSPRARANGLAFAAGWVLGVAALVSIFALLADDADTDRSSSAIVGVVKLLLGAALLVLAVRQWRSRPAHERDSEMPTWMQRLDAFTPRKALRMALLLSVGSPKNVVLAAAAGATAGQMGLTPVQIAIVVPSFTAVASVTVAGPVIYYLRGGEPALERMKEVQQWLVQNNAVLMAILLLILGAVLVGNGMRELAGGG